MNKYKEDYYIFKQKDNSSNYSSNKDDNYIKCKNQIQIYRYNSNTLVVCFKSNGVANNRIKELAIQGVILTPFQIGDDERTYKFDEVHFPIVAAIIKAKKRIKLNLSDEERASRKERLTNSRRK